MTIFTQDIHSEYTDGNGSVIWGFTELDMDADMHGMDDLFVLPCENCGSQLFASLDGSNGWEHITQGDCHHPAPIWG